VPVSVFYIDRAALGILQPVLAKAMNWTAQDYANNNNYSLLFTMIPAAYFIALTWVYFVAPRRVETVD